MQEGAVSVIQMKDINSDLTIVWDGLVRVQAEKMNDSAYVNKGEVLFANRGSRNYAALVDRAVSDVIAVGNFFIVKVKIDAVLSEYLAWYLNQKRAQKYFDQHREGSYIPTMRGEWLNELDVFIPAIAVQEKVVALARLQKRELELSAAIQTKKNLLIEEIINKKILLDSQK